MSFGTNSICRSSDIAIKARVFSSCIVCIRRHNVNHSECSIQLIALKRLPPPSDSFIETNSLQNQSISQYVSNQLILVSFSWWPFRVLLVIPLLAADSKTAESFLLINNYKTSSRLVKCFIRFYLFASGIEITSEKSNCDQECNWMHEMEPLQDFLLFS